ncbi:MAG: hypothetical protein MNPFHGCM_01915 [Gemmatimonadaceae bacterium]|nr:hypothetical protein [Gemmatimonadaceae bacterium]
MERREFFRVVAMTAVAGTLLPESAYAHAVPIPMTVYKTPTCGCCKEWVKHVQGAGFAPKVIDMDDLTKIKQEAGVPDRLQSCHTAYVGAFVIEGHVPADLIQKMLKEKPAIRGLAVPGMVTGSPGMEMGDRKDPYDVIAFTKDGKSRVYAKR